MTHDAQARQPGETRVKPLDPPMTPFALGGMATWAVSGLVLWIASAPHRWLWICVAGFLLGLPGWAFMRGHDRRRAVRLEGAARPEEAGRVQETDES